MNAYERWAFRALFVLTALLFIVGLWALLIPSSDQGYSCDPLILGGDASDPEVAALAGSFAPCDSDGRLVTVVVAVLLVVAAMVALATIRRAALREQGHDDPVEVAGS